MKKPILLSSLRTKEDMEIVDIDTNESSKNRLFSLGFVPGTVVSYVTKTAFGGPIAFLIQGCRMAIRKQDADCILVKPI
ncbi:MAG: ferrous iron transport protein A [Candidatus Margulisbacteria bacterium]|nr:ferrous iron transport protein A [Candidatus Margulisiibacteriota bacterium]